METDNIPAKGGTDRDKMRTRLENLRLRSIEASRRGDFRRVAQLTIQTARLNCELQRQPSLGF